LAAVTDQDLVQGQGGGVGHSVVGHNGLIVIFFNQFGGFSW